LESNIEHIIVIKYKCTDLIVFWTRGIYIDDYMAFFISYPLSALGHDISPRADRLKDYI
jgi:hypothetical protein